MDLRDKIRSVMDFPKPGIHFRDITPVLLSPDYFSHAVDLVAALAENSACDTIASPEARGFLLGVPAALKLKKGFVPVRKAGKLPYLTIKRSYALEYGEAEVEIHADAISPGQNVVIIDDLLATGGTCKAICELIEQAGGRVSKIIFLVELKDLDGRKVLEGYDVDSVLLY